jgi:di/tricarboxylate transporter
MTAMTNDQILILFILTTTMAMFLWGRWRHDMVALGALIACVIGGLVAPGEAFSGFGHPAVVTVACVLVLSRGLQLSGAVDVLARYTLPKDAGPTLSLAALIGLGAVLSGFMNNVGAMALLMPVAIQLADRLEFPPGRVLMPLAFGTILGGMTTLIGTPPNLIVSGFRSENGASPFGMFDFTPVGLAVAGVGVVFVTLVGWRLVPARKRPGSEGFDTGAYITEARVPDKSKAVGMTLREIERELDEADAQVLGLVRNETRMNAPSPAWTLKADDILIIEAEVDALAGVLSNLGLKLEEASSFSEEEEGEKKEADKPAEAEQADGGKTESDQAGARRADETEEKAKSMEDIALAELVVRPESALAGRSASDILLRTRYGLNLLAVSREGARSKARLRTLRIRSGDLLLMQGPSETLAQFASDFGCIPLAERELRIPDRRMALLASGIMVASVATAALGVLPTAVAFAAGVLASMALLTVPPRAVYSAIDWPVIVLLGALLPVAGAMEATGTADLIAQFLMDDVAKGHVTIGLTLILVVTMFLSDLMNNAATAAVMCPIAIGTASALGVNTDPFLMAVAIGASCAFLTPIGHQNNTLILGPGGFRFGDYWRLGLPLEALVVAVSIPLLPLIWPL